MPIPLAIPLALGAAGLIGKGVNYFGAMSDQRSAQNQLNNLSKQALPRFAANPALLNYYSRNLNMSNNPRGFSGAERSAFNSGIANTINTQASNANRMSGGNLSRYITNALNPAVVGAQNQFAAQDAQLARSQQNSALGRLGSAVSALQGIDNQNTQAELQRRLMTEQALGQSILQNKNFQTSTLEGLSSDLLGGALMMGMGGSVSPNLWGGNVSNRLRRNVRFNTNPAIGDPNYVPPELLN